MIAPAYSAELADLAICHRNVALGAGDGGEGVFISTRCSTTASRWPLSSFINVGHAFVDEAGVAEDFAGLVWAQATADVRGETSMDAWECRATALGGTLSSSADGGNRTGKPRDGKSRVDEKARTEFLEAAFSDAVAIYLLSLTVDFDYSELGARIPTACSPRAG